MANSDMAVDRFNVRKIYPTKEGARVWYSNWQTTRRVQTNDFDPHNPSFGVTCANHSQDRGLYIGGGVAKWKKRENSPRMWVKGYWLNTEQTIYVKVNTNASSIQLRSRSNHHGPDKLPYRQMQIDPVTGSDSISCGFGGYVIKWGEDQLDFCSIELEYLHGLYKRHIVDVDIDIPKGKWIGFKGVTRNVENNTKMKLEGWTNLNPFYQANWKKTIEFTFDGTNAPATQSTLDSHTDEISLCTGKRDNIAPNINASTHQFYNKPAYWNWVRINDAENVDMKYYSIREITAG